MEDKRQPDNLRTPASAAPTRPTQYRRVSASPNIRQLVDRFEGNALPENGPSRVREGPRRASAGGPQPTVRMRVGEMDWNPIRANAADVATNASTSRPSRKITTLAHPRSSLPIASCSLKAFESHSASSESKRATVDGLPSTDGGSLSPFISAVDRADIASISVSDKTTIPLESLQSTSDSCTRESQMPKGEDSFKEEENRPLVDETEDETYNTLAFLRGETQTSSLKPFPAHKIFAPNAHPLYLPHLDEYLATDKRFHRPLFSYAKAICSERERRLYGYEHPKTFVKSSLEVCGAQLSIPADAAKVYDLRKRRKKHKSATEPDLELATLTKDELTDPVDTLEDKRFLHEESSPVSDSISYWSNGQPTTALPIMASSQPAKSRLDKFPPLMLLSESSLDELKSNAVGPRKPPGGFVSYFPSLGSIMGTIVDFVIGVEGSTFAAGLFRLQLLMDFVQLTHLNSFFLQSTAGQQSTANRVLLFTLPSFLSLDFVSVFGLAFIIFLCWVAVVAVLLFRFWRMTKMYNPNRNVEGYESQPWLFRPFSQSQPNRMAESNPNISKTTPAWRSTPWTKFTNITVVTLLTLFYIPVGKLALDAITWNVDYHASNANNQHLENPILWRDPSDFCYTTTMRRDQFNWAPIIVSVASCVVVVYLLWFPWQMRRTILTLLPRVPKYNEMGQERTIDNLNSEYIRLLNRDHSPLNFLYNAYKRTWGNYKPLYLLCFKASNMIIISVFAQDNCLCRRFSPATMLIAQESVLIAIQIVLLILHLSAQPFVDSISNRSELISRVGYVISSVLGLLAGLQLKNYEVYRTWIMYIVYAVTYTGNFYFALIGTTLVSHWVKRCQRRTDFSIDVFSPYLHLERHIKRRVWQETLSTILLTGQEYHMPLNQLVTFSVLPELCPPYLLSFQGTAAERHVENLKIVKQVGMDEYREALEHLRGPESKRWRHAMEEIQLYFAGPDAYWKPLSGSGPAGVSSFFGKAFLVPFPPTLVMSYDQSPADAERVMTLTTLSELEQFLWQNRSEIIRRRRWVRSVLRSLDGERVTCPHVQSVKYSSSYWGTLQSALGAGADRAVHYSLAKPVFYSEGFLSITRKRGVAQDGFDFQSGFDVRITYDFGQRQDAGGASVVRTKVSIDGAAAFGLRDDFEWTTSVKQFFHANNDLIRLRLGPLQQSQDEYRRFFHREAAEKQEVMAYSFLSDVFDQPVLHASQLEDIFRHAGCSATVRHLPRLFPATTTLLLERLNVLARSTIHGWWYLFWDDLWRQNSADYKALRRCKRIFSPQFSSSIAWTPLPRRQLEELLKSKGGLWSESARKRAIFTPGLLNKIYFALDELAFLDEEGRNSRNNCRSSRDEPVELGVADKEGVVHSMPLSHLFATTRSQVTGGGTEHDESSILDRHDWVWTEQRLGGAQSTGLWQSLRRFLALNPHRSNRNAEKVWIYAKLTQDGAGQWRYEAEKRRRKRTLPPYRRRNEW